MTLINPMWGLKLGWRNRLWWIWWKLRGSPKPKSDIGWYGTMSWGVINCVEGTVVVEQDDA